MQQRLPKYYRTEQTRLAVANRHTTERDLTIIETIARYRFIPSSLLVRLVPGVRDATYHHLQTLYHRQLINRFHIPRHGWANEFIYYLDNPHVAELLHSADHNTNVLDLAEVKRDREHAYWRANDPRIPDDEKPDLLFIRHELMITRFQSCLELACNASGNTKLVTFCRRRSSLKRNIEAPKLTRTAAPDGSFVWTETEEMERLPHNPDAFFTLHCADKPADNQQRHFFYEADRKTEDIPRFTKKLRAHHEFIVRQKHHRHIETHYGVNRIRAVLTETINDDWAHRLRMEAARSPQIGSKPSPLFWFTTSRLLTAGPDPEPLPDDQRRRQPPFYLNHPQIILRPIWATSVDDKLHSLFD